MKLSKLREELSQKEQETKDAEHSSLQSCRVTADKKPWNVIAGTHARARAFVRHPEKDSVGWQDLHRKVLRGIESAPKKNGMYVAMSKSHGHGVVAHIDHDIHTMRIHTILDKGQKHATHEGDHKILVEKVLQTD